MIMEGVLREDAALQAGMERQTLRDWVHHYNETGVAGLVSRLGPGPQPKLAAEQMQILRDLVVAGPGSAERVVRWRCLDLREEVAKRFAIKVAERTIGKWLRQLGLTRLQRRPFHLQKDAAAQEAFKKVSLAW